jgi:isoleucyl-tRNA synthetase
VSPSVHLCDWPAAGPRDEGLESAMATARETVRLGLAARGQAKVKIRQPLREAVVVAAGPRARGDRAPGRVVREELNVKALRFVEAADELGATRSSPTTARSARASASGCRRWPRRWRRSTRARGAAVREERPVGIAIDGHDHQLGPDDLQLVMSRWRATSSSARARTRWPSSWS